MTEIEENMNYIVALRFGVSSDGIVSRGRGCVICISVLVYKGVCVCVGDNISPLISLSSHGSLSSLRRLFSLSTSHLRPHSITQTPTRSTSIQPCNHVLKLSFRWFELGGKILVDFEVLGARTCLNRMDFGLCLS